jgi:hypothetical protein
MGKQCIDCKYCDLKGVVMGICRKHEVIIYCDEDACEDFDPKEKENDEFE